jgi:hypothetical protein
LTSEVLASFYLGKVVPACAGQLIRAGALGCEDLGADLPAIVERVLQGVGQKVWIRQRLQEVHELGRPLGRAHNAPAGSQVLQEDLAAAAGLKEAAGTGDRDVSQCEEPLLSSLVQLHCQFYSEPK